MPKRQTKENNNVVKMGKIQTITMTVRDLVESEKGFEEIVKFPEMTGLLSSKLNRIRRDISHLVEPSKEARKALVKKLVAEYEKENPESKGKNLLNPAHYSEQVKPIEDEELELNFIPIDGNKFYYESVNDKKVERFDSDLDSSEKNGIGQWLYYVMWAITDPDE